MTVPGQNPASEVVEVAFPPGAAPQTEINGRSVYPPVSRDEATNDPFPGFPELMPALSRAFDPACDRILWEAARFARDEHPSAAATVDFRSGRAAALNGSQHVAPEFPRWFSEVRRGTGLSVALGMSAARRNFGQEHWIVVVASASHIFRGLSHDLIEQLHEVESRLLIVVIDDGQPSPVFDRPHRETGRTGQFDLLDARWLSELGLPCHEAAAGCGTAALLAELQQIVQSKSSTVLHVRVPALRSIGSELPTESSGRGMLRLFGRPDQNGVDPPVTVLDAVADELEALARIDRRVVAIVQDSLRSRFPFCRRRPDRSYSLPSAGQGSFTRSRGLALGGCRPFIILSDRYLQKALDQLTGQLCDSRQPVTLIVEPASGPHALEDAGVTHPPSDLAYLRLLPGSVVVVPRSNRELRRLLRWSLDHPGPVAIQLPQRMGSDTPVPDDAVPDDPIELGRAEVLVEGLDVTLLALGSQVPLAMRAAHLLSLQGVSAGVVDARFVSPMDGALLHRLGSKVGGFVTLEEGSPQGGFGAAVLEQLAAAGITTPLLVSGQGAVEASAGGAVPQDEAVGEVVRLATSLVDHAAGVSGFYGTSPRRANAGRPRVVAPPDFSPAALERERNLVANRTLSPEVEEWFAIYSQVGERRRFLWQWCELGADLTTLPSVPPALFQHVCQTKVLSIMLCVLLDDVADQRGRDKFLEVLLKIVDDQPAPDLAGMPEQEKFYVEITRRLADIYHERVRGYPCHAAYADLLRYDQLQYFNTMRYSQLLNQNLWLLNPVEHDLYLPHAMDMMSFATIDLMCAADFSCRELGKLREALWFLQCMGRVGNLLCTWRREIGQQDFTSGVFARAIAQGDLTVEQLHAPDTHEIETAILKGGHEQYFLRRWRYYRECFLVAAESIESVDMLQLLEGNERFFRMHLASRGLI